MVNALFRICLLKSRQKNPSEMLSRQNREIIPKTSEY